ncbi:helix-turn-helix domain-containing protein [Leptolyngbya sp. FACHB-261]|uniref:helix-turn-helix domain-containing protein n=1 Tax=Leptolyngbya sp. FACHB-261 TaxID=2692806 RepID=UPI0016892098|nr:helix-turn-helix domain-containing protein [Leptolyngbya sp. FACHB-261]MBD2099815.1 helix-turn-helix domain-containing protein [Leptolyngbya sp. FACHB-261]
MARSKLTDADRAEILRLYRQSEETTATLAERYGVSGSTVSRILKDGLPAREYNNLISRKRASRPTAAEDAPGESDEQGANQLSVLSIPEAALETTDADLAEDTEEDEVAGTDPDTEVGALIAELAAELASDLASDRERSDPQETVAEELDTEEPDTEELDTEELDTDQSEAAILEVSEPVPAPEPPTPVLSVARPILKSVPAPSKVADLEPKLPTADTRLLNDEFGAGGDLEDDLDSPDFEDDDEDDEDKDLDEGEEAETAGSSLRLHSEQGEPIRILPLESAQFPRVCYIAVDRRTSELVTRPLRDFGDLGQFPPDEVQEKTLPVFDNHRVASRFSNRAQRVIKFPGNLLAKTHAYLQAKGITRLLIDGRVYALDLQP